MLVSDAQKKATIKYNKNNYDQIAIRVPKSKRDKYKQLAELNKMSLSGYIQYLLDNELKKNNL